ncbi:MAG: PEP-CTERM sorting domain-containing protein [Lacipirellulaceae bacterium]
MKKLSSYLFAATGLIGLIGAGQAVGQITIDGTADIGYGSSLSIQDTNTQFGNATDGDPINGGGGSEINQVFGTVDNGRLYVTITGNLETNFNKLEIFIDSVAGGVNTIDGANLPGGVDPFCCGGFEPPNGGNTDNTGALQRMEGLTFDTGFEADHYLTITHGFETALDSSITFYAASAHYADLTQGASGDSAALGMQLAHRGLPNVLRGTTGDFDVDGNVDGGEFLTFQRNLGALNPTRNEGDATGDGMVNADDLGVYQTVYGFDVANAGFDGFLFAPQNGAIDNSDSLLGPALPGLSQGELIDKNYVLAPGPGGATDASGAGRITEELEFALPVDPADTGNTFSHRDMDNIVDLELAIDNSNTEGVSGDGPFTTPTTGDPENVMTGVEFSIPLSEIGNPTGDIKIVAFINGGGHDFASNQFTGDGVLDANLGGNGFGGFTGDLSGVDLSDFAGDQFVTVTQVAPSAGAVPEPTGLALMLVGTAFGMIRRRS